MEPIGVSRMEPIGVSRMEPNGVPRMEPNGVPRRSTCPTNEIQNCQHQCEHPLITRCHLFHRHKPILGMGESRIKVKVRQKKSE